MKTKGWQKVFSFTLVQHIKSKSFIVGTVIVCVIVMLLCASINVLPALLSGGEDVDASSDGSVSAVSRVYLFDEAGILTDEDTAAITADGVHLSDTDKSPDELIGILETSEGSEAVIILSAEESEGEVVGFVIKTYYSPDSDSDSIDALSTLVSEYVTYRNLLNAGVSPETYAAAQRYISVSKIQAGNDEWSIFESLINYIVPMVVSIILFILIFLYGNTVAQSIATEKTSRVMELLLVSVRPLAVVIGKVLAMGIISIGQFLLICIVGSVSFLVTAPLGIGGLIMDAMSSAELYQTAASADDNITEAAQAIQDSLGGFSVLTALLILIVFILGFLFFSLIAALIGASVSRTEDLPQAMTPYSMLGVIGFYLAYFPILFTAESFETGSAVTSPMQMFSYFFPISSPFALPSALMLGTLSTAQAIAAVLILAVCVALIAVVVSKVYEGLILHNGSRLKLSDIFKMAARK